MIVKPLWAKLWAKLDKVICELYTKFEEVIILKNILLSLSIIALALPGVFIDIADHWARDEIVRWGRYGVISGYEGHFRPQDEITVAEFAAVLEGLMGLTVMAEFDPEVLTDLDPYAWYFDTMLKMAAAGIVTPSRFDGTVGPTRILTRELAATMSARAFDLPIRPGATAFLDNTDIATALRPYVRAMQEAGFVTGFPFMSGFQFRPAQPVTRAEAVAMINAMVDLFVNDGGLVTEDVDGNVLISAADVVLRSIHVSGNITVSGGADVVLDDVTLGGSLNVLGDSLVTIQNSRIPNIMVNDRQGDVIIETLGATTVQTVEMRSGGLVMANQNDYNYVHQVIIPADFPEGARVVLEGNFRLMTNNAGPQALHSRDARFNTGPIPTPREAAASLYRPTSDRIALDLTSSMLGLAHVLIVHDTATSSPTAAQMRNPAAFRGDVFDYGTFRVFPGNREIFTFFGADEGMTIDTQGQRAYVLIENERGNRVDLYTTPAFFMPGVTHLSVISDESVVANFDIFFPHGAAVEDSFDLFILSGGIERRVTFRAFNVVPDAAVLSQTFRLTVILGESIEEGDVVILRPRNNPALAHASALFDRDPLNYIHAMPNVGGIIDVVGNARFPLDIAFVLTDEYVPGYYLLAGAISANNFPVSGGTIRYGTFQANPGSFHFTIPGIPDTTYYYLYMVVDSEVRLLIVER